MKQILKLVFLLVIGQTAFAQAPSNYTNINGRYRWIAGMFDSTFHIPKGSTPSLRTGGSTNSGGLFYNTSDSSVYTYTGTQWIKLRGSINPSDTTNKYVTQVYKKSGSDSIFYVKGGVHTWAFNDSTGSPGGGGGGKVYYFNGGVNMGTIGGLQMYELGDTANTGAAANFTRSTTGNIANFITDPGKPGLLQIPAGVWSVDAWLSETGGGANHAEIWIEVEKWDGSTITTIATSPIEQITEGATPNLYSWSVSIPTTSLTVTDRIIIQFYISNTNGKTVTLYTQNGYVGEVHTTFTTGIGAINGLTAPAQYLVTGTSGTDFNINSATATHTFNLPTASATNRGALSTTDWTTFNNKIGGSLVNGYLTKATGTNTIDTSQFFQNGQNVGLGTIVPDGRLAIVDTGGFALKINYNSASTDANNNAALYAENNGLSSYVAILNEKTTNNTGGQYPILIESSLTSGTAQSGMATGIHFGVPDDAGNRKVTQLALRTTDPAAATYTNRAELRLWNNGSLSTPYYLLGNGNMGLGTATPDSNLTVVNGALFQRGVRMSGLPTGVGTKAVRINANGTLSVADTLANGISGTGTTNYIPKFTSSSAIGNSIFTESGGNTLRITAASAAVRLTGSNEYLLQTVDTDGRFRIYDQTAAVERITLTSSGNLGINTTSPDGKLHVLNGSAGTVTANANADDLVVENSSTGGLSILTPDINTGYIIFGSPSDNEGAIIRYNQSGALMTIGTELAGGQLTFRTGAGSERMRLDASGNLGLGVTPASWYSTGYSALQVRGLSLYSAAGNDGNLVSNAYLSTAPAWTYLTTGTATRYEQGSGSHKWYNAPSGTAGNAISFTQAMTLDASGSLGIGSTSLTGYNLRVEKNLTGSTTSTGIASFGQIQSDATANARYFSSQSSQAAGFTTTNIQHYHATQGTLSGTVTNQIAFNVASTLTGGASNFAFKSDLDAGTNRWNLYMNGTANNYLAGSLGIGTTSLTGYGLRVLKSITGATTSLGIVSDGAIQADVTNTAAYFRSVASASATPFALTDLAHFQATTGSLGSASITSQYGFLVASSMTAASNNFAFYGNLAAATGRWNLYMNGTADNYLAGKLAIGTTSPSASALLDVSSTTQGFLPPRMTGAQAEAIATPAAGLMIYANNGNGTTITSTGWWGYDGTTWVKLN